MSTEIRVEVSGITIRVSRSNPEPFAHATASPDETAAPVSPSSSFELVEGAEYEGQETYAAEAGLASPYPLQGLEPRSPLVPGLSVSVLPEQASSSQSLPRVRRSLISSPNRVPEYPLQGPAGPTVTGQDLPPLPEALRDTCRGLRGGTLTWTARAERAWRAGCFARLVLQGTLRYPDASPPTGLTNRFYCVLRADGLSCPKVVRSFCEYKAIVGTLSGTDSVSQAFPSESEARLYFAGACLAYPL